MAHSIAVNTLIASVGRGFNLVVGIFIVGILTRYLGPGGYGSYATLLAYGAILQIAADLGLYLTVTKKISEHPSKENYYISHIVSLRLGALILVFSAGSLMFFISESFRPLLSFYPVIVIGFMAQSISQLLMGVYQKYSTVWRPSVGDVVGRLSQAVGLLVLGTSKVGLAAASVMFTVSTVVALSIHKVLLPSSIKIRFKFSKKVWQKLVSASLPLGAMLILNAIYFRLDTVMLAILRNPEEVGSYGLSYRLIESSLFFPAMFGGLLLPKLSVALKQGNKDSFVSYFSQGLAAMIFFGVLFSSILFLAASPIIILIAGEGFVSSVPILQILSVALFVMFIGNISGFALVSLNEQKNLLKLSAVLVLFNIILNGIFIPSFGAVGAAFTTLATELVAASIAILLVKRRIRIKLPPYFIVKLLVVITLTALVFVFLPASYAYSWRLAFAAIVYLLISFTFRVINKDSLNLLFN